MTSSAVVTIKRWMWHSRSNTKATPGWLKGNEFSFAPIDAIDLEHTYKSATQNRGDDVSVEYDDYAVVYNGSVGGTYEVMRKVTEQEVRDNISRYGLPSEATADVEDVGKAMIAEDFSDLSKPYL